MKRSVLALLLFCSSATAAIAQEFVVKPEQVTTLELSSTDVNRVSCSGPINDVVFSEEKGITVKKVGDSAFIKFLIKMINGKQTYVTQRTEFHIVCEGQVYTFIGKPRQGGPVTVRLSDETRSRIDDNIALFKGLSHEEAIVKVTNQVIQQKNLDTARQISDPRSIDAFSELAIKKLRSYQFDGVGFKVHEYVVTPTKDLPTLNERIFIDTRFGKQIFGITLIPQPLLAGKPSRLIIVDGSI